MFEFNNSTRLKIAGTVLLAMTLRSFVAAGWMLQIPASSGLNTPLLSICPLQTPGIDEWLTTTDVPHVHHSSEHGDDAYTSSLTVTDSSCANWASSALTALIADNHDFDLPESSSQIDPVLRLELDRRQISSRRTRAPPHLS